MTKPLDREDKPWVRQNAEKNCREENGLPARHIFWIRASPRICCRSGFFRDLKMRTFSTRRRREDQLGLGGVELRMRFPTFPPSPSRRRRQFTDFAVAVKTWVFIPLFLSCTLHFFFFFFSFLISTNHLGMCQATLAAFCTLFTDKNLKITEDEGSVKTKQAPRIGESSYEYAEAFHSTYYASLA